MNKNQIESITDDMVHNVSAIRYGQVSVTLTIHDGRITAVTHTVTQHTREVTK